ncbi:MAG: hypothetical protein M5R36_04075 [Deltaproteobacteria bacterium]|nr:hypothetical protein [Deltaproteobacteria bacterium]
MAIPPPKDIDYDEWIKAQTLAENAWRATIPGMLVLLVGQLWLIRSLILHFPVISAIASGIRTISGIFFAIGFCFGVLALIYHPDRSNDRLYVLKAVVAIAALPVLIVVMWIVWPLIIANVGGTAP